MSDAQLRFLEDATQHLSGQLSRQAELCRQLLAEHPALSDLHASTVSLAEQLQQMLGFARELHPPLNAREFSLVETLELARELAAPEALARKVEVSIQVHSSLHGLWLGDVACWRQILVNTLAACVQNCKSGTLHVSLTSSRPDGEELVARLVVSGATLDTDSLAMMAVRHTVEKVGGRIFMAGPAYAVSVPVERPLRYASGETVCPLELLAEFQETEESNSAAGYTDYTPTEAKYGDFVPSTNARLAEIAGINNYTEPVPVVALPAGMPAEPKASELSPDLWYDEAAGLQKQAPPPGPAPAVLARCRRMLHELAQKEDWARLEEAAAELLAAVPDCLLALQHLSLARVRQDDWNGAFPVLRQLAMRYLETDNVEQARALLKQMLNSLPDPATGLHLAEDCLQQGEMGLAESFFQAAADAWFAQGALSEGLEALRRLQVLKPADLTLAQAIAGMLMRLGQHREAVTVYRNILKVSPSHRGGLEGLALAAEVTGDEELGALVRRRLSRPPSVRINRASLGSPAPER